MSPELIKMNAERWANCHISTAQGPAFQKVADVLTANKGRYLNVSQKLAAMGYNIPWWFIAVAHYREAGFNNQNQPRWDTYLGNGQSLSRKTTIVPKGRGPWTGPTAWEDGAVDALVYAPPYAAKNRDWSIGGALTKLEEYNGLGYFHMGKPSPYVWARTDQYTSGKYVADGVYDPNHVDTQLGVAGILKFMGVFKTAPTGAGAATGAVAAGLGAAIAAKFEATWAFVSAHWIALLLGVVATSFIIDIILYYINERKNKLNVKD